MSVRAHSLLDALEADPTVPGPEPRAALTRWFASVHTLGGTVIPTDVRDALLSALVDPDRRAWSRAALWGLDLAVSAGAAVVGLANDEVVELTDKRGERFGLVPVDFRPRADPLGSVPDAERLLEALDRTFGHRRYLVSLRRPVPVGLDVAPILTAVQLWLAQIDRGPGERHATYEDGDVMLDLTLVDGQKKGSSHGSSHGKGARGGRILTVRPMVAIEQLGIVDGAMIDTAARCEESLGSLPVVMVVAYEEAWRAPRGFVQQLLYGTPDAVRVDETYEADFTANGRSLFSDGGARTVAALWWIAPESGGGRRIYVNPWTFTSLSLSPPDLRFVPLGEPDGRGRATLRWVRGP